jgi:hypothetical protein
MNLSFAYVLLLNEQCRDVEDALDVLCLRIDAEAPSEAPRLG